MLLDHIPNVRALRREWLAARIVATIGGTLLIAVLGLIVAQNLAITSEPLPPVPTEIAPAPPQQDTAAARRAEDIALCDAALAAVQEQGLLPGFAVRDGDVAAPAQVQGRYVCRARTTAATYTIAFDLACTHLGQAGCIVPVTVAQDGGGVLYQKP